jgi:molybdopterin synthase catalytic subunit
LSSSQERRGTISEVINLCAELSKGKKVIRLDYEAYPDMALPSLRSISAQAKNKWDLLGVAVTHRLGRVPTGEESILIAVSSAHRQEGWRAAEWILEEVKRKTEIWKKESYDDPSEEAQWKENFPGTEMKVLG